MFVNGEEKKRRRLTPQVSGSAPLSVVSGGIALVSGRLKLKGRRTWNQGLTV